MPIGALSAKQINSQLTAVPNSPKLSDTAWTGKVMLAPNIEGLYSNQHSMR